MVNSKKCYLCLNQFTKLNEEHVIGAAFKGTMVSYNYCLTCNNKLGRLIDEPFSNHLLMLNYRLLYDLSRDGRAIKSPFQGEIIEDNGNRYIVEINENKQFVRRMITNLPDVSNLKIGEKAELNIDIKEESDLPKLLRRLEKKYKEQTGKDVKMIVADRKVEKRDDTIKQVLYDANNTLVLGFSKILFEAACELVDGYVDSNMARRYAEMLSNGEIDYGLRPYIEVPKHFTNFIVREVLGCLQNPEEYVIMISGFHGVGLVGLVKMFNEVYVAVLSDEVQFASQTMTFFYDEFKSKKSAEIYSTGKIPKADINIDSNIGIDTSLMQEGFATSPEGNVNLFSSDGSLKLDSVFEIIGEFNVPRTSEGDFKKGFSTTHYVNNSLYVYPKSKGVLIPLRSIKLHHKLTKLDLFRSHK